MSGIYTLPTTPKGQLSSETPATFFAKLTSGKDEKQDKDDKKDEKSASNANVDPSYSENNNTPPVVPFPSPNLPAPSPNLTTLPNGGIVGVAVAAIIENGVVPTFTNEASTGNGEPSLHAPKSVPSPAHTDAPTNGSPYFSPPLSQRRKTHKTNGSAQSSPETSRASNSESESPTHTSLSQRRKKPRLSVDEEGKKSEEINSDDSEINDNRDSESHRQHGNISLRRRKPRHSNESLPDISCPPEQPSENSQPIVAPSDHSDSECEKIAQPVVTSDSNEKPISLDSSHSPTRDSVSPAPEFPLIVAAAPKSASIAFLCSSDDVTAVPEPDFHYPSIREVKVGATKMEVEDSLYAMANGQAQPAYHKSQMEVEMEAKAAADIRIMCEPDSALKTAKAYDGVQSLRSESPALDNPAMPRGPKRRNKRAKNEVAPADPSTFSSSSSAVSHRLRSSTKRPSSPTPLDPPSSPDHASRLGKVAKRRQQPTEPQIKPTQRAHSTRQRHHSPPSSAPPSPVQSPLPEPLSPPQYPHLPHPPMLNSFSYPLHGAPHRVPEPYIFAYSTSNSFASPPSPPPVNTSSVAAPPSSRKVPSCTRCAARAAWKHDKKGKRWFCKVCKLPFTPGVSPAHQKMKEVITIPPCPKCYSNEGWKQDKGKYFCTHCKQSFRPRIARTGTRSSSRRFGDKKDDSYDGEEDEEGEGEDGEDDEGDYDSDYGANDVSAFTPDLETNYPYYRGDNKYATRKMANIDGANDDKTTNKNSHHHNNKFNNANNTNGKYQSHITTIKEQKQPITTSKPSDHSFHQVPNFIQAPSYHPSAKDVEAEDSFDNDDVTQILLGMRSSMAR